MRKPRMNSAKMPSARPQLGAPRLGALEEACDLGGAGCPAPFVCHGWVIPRTWNRSTACDAEQWPCHDDFHAKRRGFAPLTTPGGRCGGVRPHLCATAAHSPPGGQDHPDLSRVLAWHRRCTTRVHDTTWTRRHPGSGRPRLPQLQRRLSRRSRPAMVVAFTATQIPGIAQRRYPACAGRPPLSARHPDRGRSRPGRRSAAASA